jgi:hypothetical protein
MSGGCSGHGERTGVDITTRMKVRQLEKENQEMKKLLKQVVAVMDSESYAGQVSMAWVHGFRYTGPMINMKRIRELLGMKPNVGDHGEDAV